MKKLNKKERAKLKSFKDEFFATLEIPHENLLRFWLKIPKEGRKEISKNWKPK